MDNAIILTALNISNPPDKLPVIYRNTSCELEIILTNKTGNEISLQQKKSAFKIKIPGITADEIAVATISLDKWTTEINKTCIQLTYNGDDGAKWSNNQKLTITISNLKTAAQPSEKNIQVNVSGFIPELKPSQLFTPIVISNPTKPGNADLREVLQLTLDNGGAIYISSEPGTQKLENELLLNIKNTGSVPLYTGTKKIQPRIGVTFIYGSTIGCLTPASAEEGGTYAWDIHASIPYKSADYLWTARQPSSSSGDIRPKWVFEPGTTNSGLIGTGPDANITFSFSKIVAATPVGHTQVLLHFSGFMKDDNTAYDDALFIFDIDKKAPPANSGVVYFYGVENKVDVYNPASPGEVEFRWVLYNVAEIKIEFNNPTESKSKKYPSSTPLASDQMSIPLGHVTENSILATLTAYSAAGKILNKIQFTLSVRKCFFTDSRDDVQYPGVRIGNRIWMTKNLGNNNPQSRRNKYGCLYSREGAEPPALSEGWKLPNPDDWKDLMDSCPPSESPYAWLIDGGKSGFNAVLGGYIKPGGAGNKQQDIVGRYWLSKEDGLSNSETVSFDSVHANITYGDDVKMHKDSYVAVRYVKKIEK